MLVPVGCSNKKEHKEVEFLFPEKNVPVQNEALPDLLDRQASRFSASLSRLECHEISMKIPALRAQKRPNILVGRFCALEMAVPGATRGGGRYSRG